MSSYKMHLAISKKLMNDLKLGNDFLLGSILPDLLKIIIKDRDSTHFQEKNCDEKLPNIELFISKYGNLHSDLMYGYLAHLIEDYIWFHDYINLKYKNKYSDNEIYSDYGIIDEYITNKISLDMKNIKENLKKSALNYKQINGINNEKIIHMIETNIINYGHEDKIKFFTPQDADQYFEKAYTKAKIILEKLL